MVFHPSSMSSRLLAPVRTTFPLKNINMTTLTPGYLKISPGNMCFWYVLERGYKHIEMKENNMTVPVNMISLIQGLDVQYLTFTYIEFTMSNHILYIKSFDKEPLSNTHTPEKPTDMIRR